MQVEYPEIASELSGKGYGDQEVVRMGFDSWPARPGNKNDILMLSTAFSEQARLAR